MSDYFLTEERPPDEPRRRSRWVDAAGLAAIVGVILAVGVLGDPGPRDDASAPDTTTTTERTPRRTDYDDLTTTTAPSTTTSTTTVVDVGRRLDVETDTILLIEGQTRSQLLDVDAGVLRPIDHRSNGGTVAALDGGFLAMTGGGLYLIPLEGEARPFSDEVLDWASPHRSPTGTIWVQGQPDLALREYEPDGRPTGRRLTIPMSAYLAGVVEQGLVVQQAGSIALIDPDSQSTRALGHGEVLGARGRTMVRMSCEALECAVEAVDTRTGRARPIAGAPTDGYRNEPGRFSPDGRWFAYPWAVADRQELVVLDLERGRRVDVGGGSLATFDFSFAGGQLFALDGLTIRAYDLVAGTWNDVVPAGYGVTSGRITATRGS